jgi:hypothetical protein
MVLGQPHRIDAAGLGFVHQPKALGKGLVLGHPFTAGEFGKEPEVHARLLSSSGTAFGLRHAPKVELRSRYKILMPVVSVRYGSC